MRKIIISTFFAVLGMPIDMYEERRRRDMQARRPNVQFERAQAIRWRLNYIHSMKYAEVINASIAANSAEIDSKIASPNHIFILCAAQSADYANRCFEHNIYTLS